MQRKKVLFLILFIVIILSAGFLFYRNQTKLAEAGSGENTSGFAWSSTMGWISFNNISGGGSNNYGVNINDNGATGVFSGYAWSNNAGWIDFNEANLAGCPTAPCQAIVDKKTGQVSGWAKFLTTNDWIKLKGTNYGVLISKSTGDFSGWAWGGETAGWMSFSCENGGICSPVNYRVHTLFDMNIKPTVAVGPAPNPSAVNLCSNPAYNFSWIFNDADVGDTQSQYQLQVDKEGTFASFAAGEVDITAISSSQSKEILLAKNPGLNQLSYNFANYKWRIRVWDNHLNGVSAWTNGTNFTTPIHIYPTPYFDWKPKPIIKDQLIQFLSDASECYDAFNNIISCSGANFTWTIPVNAEFASSTTATNKNPVIKFKDSGKNQLVSLQITDNVGTCSTSTNARVTLPLPKWKEILPQ